MKESSSGDLFNKLEKGQVFPESLIGDQSEDDVFKNISITKRKLKAYVLVNDETPDEFEYMRLIGFLAFWQVNKIFLDFSLNKYKLAEQFENKDK